MKTRFADNCHPAGRAISAAGKGLPALPKSGFTLLEVMIAVVVFCTATLSILALVSQSLDNARRLERPMIDAGLVASELSITNKLVEGQYSGDLGKLLGEEYKGYNWTEDVEEEQTNKLFHVDIVIQRNQGNRQIVSSMRVLFYRPDSPAGSLDGATTAR
jgi:type II secretion system protein I